MFNLITSYYLVDNEERQNELNQCLILNAKNKFIKSIFLLNDKIHDINFIESDYKQKIVQLIVNDDNKKRLHYDFAVNFINNYLYGEMCVLSNSDIYFDNTLNFLTNIDFTNQFIALSRYTDGVVSPPVSQDSWIFKSPLNIDLQKIKFKFGVPGCDNVFANIVSNSGYNVTNPCKTLISHHLHNSNYRTYNEEQRIFGDYTFVVHSSID